VTIIKSLVLLAIPLTTNVEKTYKVIFWIQFENLNIKEKQKDVDCLLEDSYHWN